MGKDESKLLRMTTEERDLLETGARIQGLSLTAFLVSSGIRETKKLILNYAQEVKQMKKSAHSNITLSPEHKLTAKDINWEDAEELIAADEISQDEKGARVDAAFARHGINVNSARARPSVKESMKAFEKWSASFSAEIEKIFGPPPEDDKEFEIYVDKIAESL